MFPTEASRPGNVAGGCESNAEMQDGVLQEVVTPTLLFFFFSPHGDDKTLSLLKTLQTILFELPLPFFVVFFYDFLGPTKPIEGTVMVAANRAVTLTPNVISSEC